uniref:ribosomal protein L9 n=1 Tax=Hypnea flava TaxID=1524266 RepID=UPI0027DA66DC|nr:ribosomal protein L9 [Hypnea flava]WCH55010.1 ribosomal protein L9 [Hypnea flava]
MNKKIKVILKDQKDKNQQDKIVSVTRGYAFNYLIPQNIAEIATPGKLKHLNMLKQKQNQKIQINQDKAKVTLKHFNTIHKINIKKKHGSKMQIFGQINEKEVLKKIFEHTGYKLNKKQIDIPNIKTVGKYQVKIQLLDSVETNLSLNIIPEITEHNI